MRPKTIFTLLNIILVFIPYFNNLYLSIFNNICIILYFIQYSHQQIIAIINKKIYSGIYFTMYIIYYTYSIINIQSSKNYLLIKINVYTNICFYILLIKKTYLKFKILIKYLVCPIPVLVSRTIKITSIYLISIQLALKIMHSERLFNIVFRIYHNIEIKKKQKNDLMMISFSVYSILQQLLSNIDLAKNSLELKYYNNKKKKLNIYYKILFIQQIKFYNKIINISYNLWNRFLDKKNFNLYFDIF